MQIQTELPWEAQNYSVWYRALRWLLMPGGGGGGGGGGAYLTRVSTGIVFLN